MAVPADQKIILITGANRGVGLAIIEGGASRVGPATFILACRTSSRGEEAVQTLRSAGVESPIEVLQLDVSDDASIEAAAAHVKEKYGRLDVLINNAAQNSFFDKEKSVKQMFADTFAINVTAVVLVTETFLPLLRASKTPTVINVSSAAGSISRQWGQTRARGPAAMAYFTSKSALNAATICMMNNELQNKEEERVKYYLTCPGFVTSGFNGFMEGGKTPIEGAEVIIRLLEGKKEYEAGKFWQYEDRDGWDMRILDW